MVYLFIASVVEICLFRFMNGVTGCPCFPPSTNELRPIRHAFHVFHERVYYTCSKRYFYDNRVDVCSTDERWDGTSYYCKKETKNVKLIGSRNKYGRVQGGFNDTCLKDLITFNASIVIEESGFHSMLDKDTFPNENGMYYVLFLNKRSGAYRYEDSSNYVKCNKYASFIDFYCDFQNLSKNVLEMATPETEKGRRQNVWKWRSLCLCVIDIHVKKSITTNTTTSSNISSNSVLAIAISCGVSLFVVFVLTVTTFIVVKRKKKKKKASKMHEEDNVYEEVIDSTCNILPQMTQSTQPKFSPVNENEFPLTSSCKCLSADEDGYIVQRTLEPLYINGFLPASSSNSLAEEKDGYLVPITVDSNDKHEYSEVVNEDLG